MVYRHDGWESDHPDAFVKHINIVQNHPEILGERKPTKD